MKRISFALMSTLTTLVLLFGYRTSTSSKATTSSPVAIGASVPSSTTSASASSGQTTGSAAAGASASSSTTSTKPTATSAASTATKTVTGTAAQTRYGPVQVQVTVQGGKITNVSVIQYPNNDGRDQEINASALPTLVNETLQAQNAQIDMVSGATYTSNGYITSLQSALDQAGL